MPYEEGRQEQRETWPGLVNKTEWQNKKQADTLMQTQAEKQSVSVSGGLDSTVMIHCHIWTLHLNRNNKDHNKASHVQYTVWLLHCSASFSTPNYNLSVVPFCWILCGFYTLMSKITPQPEDIRCVHTIRSRVGALFYLKNRDPSKSDLHRTCLGKCMMAWAKEISEDLSCWCSSGWKKLTKPSLKRKFKTTGTLSRSDGREQGMYSNSLQGIKGPRRTSKQLNASLSLAEAKFKSTIRRLDIDAHLQLNI